MLRRHYTMGGHTMGTELEIRKDQKRQLYELFEIAAEHNGNVVRRHIKALKSGMEAEDVAYVEKLFNEE